MSHKFENTTIEILPCRTFLLFSRILLFPLYIEPNSVILCSPPHINSHNKIYVNNLRLIKHWSMWNTFRCVTFDWNGFSSVQFKFRFFITGIDYFPFFRRKAFELELNNVKWQHNMIPIRHRINKKYKSSILHTIKWGNSGDSISGGISSFISIANSKINLQKI